MSTKNEPGRWPWENLADFVGGDNISMTASRLSVKPSTIHAWRSRNTRFTDQQADRHACRIGCHAWEIWPDWFD